MKITKAVLGLAIVAIAMASCSGTDFKKTKSGVVYKVFGDNKGEKIDTGDIVKFHIIQKVKDTVLSSSYTQFPRYEKVTEAGKEYDVRNAVMEALRGAHKGDSIYIQLAMDTFIKRDPTIVQNTPFRKGDKLVTTIHVLDVFKDQKLAQRDLEKESFTSFSKDPKISAQRAKDEKAIEEYLAGKGIKTQRTPWGAYIEIVQQGQGPTPQPGQFALVRYTGKDMTGKVFDSNNKPGGQLYPLQIGSGGAIMGFEDAVKQMPKGTKANVYIPSVLGYGEMGSPPVILPNQNLVFELEVVDITDNPPAPQMPPTAPTDTTKKK
jgi:FKBP-type peptidyl-prolyl cis-trans isomerase